jgi:hypothetical protein
MVPDNAKKDDNCLVLRKGRFDEDYGGGPSGLDRFFEKLRETKQRHVVIHFHGGLIKRHEGEEAAKALAPKYASTGAIPLFVIWETGWNEVLAQKLPAIFGEPIFDRIRRRVTQFVRAKLQKELGQPGEKGTDLPLSDQSQIEEELEKVSQGRELFADLEISRLPKGTSLTSDEELQIQGEINRDEHLQDRLKEIASAQSESGTAHPRGTETTVSVESLMEPAVIKELCSAQPGAKGGVISTGLFAKHIVVIVASIISRFADRRDHGRYLTIIEEILREFYVGNAGGYLWEGMKETVEGAFAFDANCGGSALITHLRSLFDDPTPTTLTLIGHSAGSIWICQLLEEFERSLPSQAKVNVIFIAPACTFERCAKAFRIAGSRIAELRIFGMGDALERRDAIAGPLYPASLLYFVSGVLEKERDAPLLGMERFHCSPYNSAAFGSIAFVHSLGWAKSDKAFVWSTADKEDGARCDMRSHGGWVLAQNTLASVLHILRNGYN